MDLEKVIDILNKRKTCNSQSGGLLCSTISCKDCSNKATKEECEQAYDKAIKALNYCRHMGVDFVTDKEAEEAYNVLSLYCEERRAQDCEPCIFAMSEDRCMLDGITE